VWRTDPPVDCRRLVSFWNFKEEVVVIPEDTVEQKPALKKRLLVATFLGLAALSTHWLPGRTVVTDAVEPQHLAAAATPDNAVTGPNSLLGDDVIDKTSQPLASADLTPYHLDVDQVVDQAGLSKMLNGMAPLSGQVAVASLDSLGAGSPVPEPRTAGLFLLAAAPVLIRRKGRDAIKA
jgi:hypothetical protein